MKLTPPLKWAGGKRWFVQQYSHLLPKRFSKYIEPFVGGGSCFFHLLPKEAILNDINQELINFYAVLKDNPKELHDCLYVHDSNHSKNYYYNIRSLKYENRIQKASQFLYLNRTCWNGLYRVNKEGIFNVPIGTKTKVLLPTDNFHQYSNALKNVKLYSEDFEEVLRLAKENDFIFIDPPYSVKHNNNGFLKYNESIFKWSDQLRLKKTIAKLIGKNVKILVCNADNINIYNLYRDIGKISRLKRHSVLAGKKEARKETSELVIQINY